MNELSQTPTWVRSDRLRRFRDRVLSWDADRINAGWEDIIVPQGAAELAIQCGDAELLDWTVRWCDQKLAGGIREEEVMMDRACSGKPIPGVCLSNYCGNWGFGFVLGALWTVRKEPRYEEAIRMVADYVVAHSNRAPDGCITHGGFSDNVWVDTLYYCAPPLAHAHAVSGASAYAEAAVEQCLLHAKHLRNKETGLWHHDANPATGVRTINLWARGNGWVLAALADVLSLVPENTVGYDEVLYQYRSLAEAIVRLQHSNGMWRVAPENPDSHLETSGTAMLLFGLTKGIHQGWLEDFVLPMIDRGLGALETWINKDGALLGSQFPSGRGGWDNLKLTPFGENTYTTGFMMRLLAARAKVGS